MSHTTETRTRTRRLANELAIATSIVAAGPIASIVPYAIRLAILAGDVPPATMTMWLELFRTLALIAWIVGGLMLTVVLTLAWAGRRYPTTPDPDDESDDTPAADVAFAKSVREAAERTLGFLVGGILMLLGTMTMFAAIGTDRAEDTVIGYAAIGIVLAGLLFAVAVALLDRLSARLLHGRPHWLGLVLPILLGLALLTVGALSFLPTSVPPEGMSAAIVAVYAIGSAAILRLVINLWAAGSKKRADDDGSR